MSGVHIRKTGAPEVSKSSDGRLTLSVPIQFKRRSGRKQVTLPNGEPGKPRPWDAAATPLQLALVVRSMRDNQAQCRTPFFTSPQVGGLGQPA